MKPMLLAVAHPHLISCYLFTSTLLPGDSAEVWCDRGPNYHDGASDEQRRDPYLLRADLYDSRVPQEPQETFRSNDGTKV